MRKLPYQLVFQMEGFMCYWRIWYFSQIYSWWGETEFVINFLTW